MADQAGPNTISYACLGVAQTETRRTYFHTAYDPIFRTKIEEGGYKCTYKLGRKEEKAREVPARMTCWNLA